jgi:hypothetical protein
METNEFHDQDNLDVVLVCELRLWDISAIEPNCVSGPPA